MKAAEIRLEPPGGTFPGVDKTLADTTGITREEVVYFNWRADELLWVIYRVTVGNSVTVTRALDRDETVLIYDIIKRSDDNCYLFIHAVQSELMGNLLSIANRLAVIIDCPFRWTDDGLHITLAGQIEDLQDAHDQLSECIEISVNWLGRFEPDHTGALAQLTDRQRQALETAYELGLYETPRETSYEEIAAELDCVPSAANDLLRRTESQLIGALLDS
jgi:hypothetical protein